MSDMISRQAAIDSFRFDDDGTPWSMDDIVYRLEQLPSAQPQTPCDVCRHYVINEIICRRCPAEPYEPNK